MNASEFPQTIVVGHDGGPSGRIALETALSLRARFASRVIVVHGLALPAPRFTGGPVAELEELRMSIETRAQDRLSGELDERLGADADGVELAVFPGDPVQAMLEVVGERNADLIVLGPHDVDGPLDFGRTARSILAVAPCAVWVQPRKVGAIERIVVPFDGSDSASEVIPVALRLAKAMDLGVTFMQAFEVPSFAYMSGDGSEIAMPTYVIDSQREAVREEFERDIAALNAEGVELAHELIDGDPAQAIGRAQGPTDLVVMATHGHRGLAAALLGSVAATVIKNGHGPVIALRSTL